MSSHGVSPILIVMVGIGLPASSPMRVAVMPNGAPRVWAKSSADVMFC